MRQFNFDNAFLNGMLAENVYMHQSDQFASPDLSMVCKLHKAIYGLKQAPRAWFNTLANTLKYFGFENTKFDHSLFVRRTNTSILYLLAYVDDIILTGSSNFDIDTLILELNKIFPLKDLGKLRYFVGLEVNYLDSGRVLLSQSKYASELLKKSRMSGLNSMPTPMISSLKLTQNDSNIYEDPKHYRSIVGALQYLTITHSELSYSVNRVSQFMHSPTINHWKAVKRILRYVQGTVSNGLIFHKCTDYRLISFADADWGADLDDRRSISGYFVFMESNLISWKSDKQSKVSKSSTEAEYRALTLLRKNSSRCNNCCKNFVSRNLSLPLFIRIAKVRVYWQQILFFTADASI
ncbi:uncharacterized mitochondrial protein AtMg00810-like [Arachis hypogaea]|uniref:uncharacterized mitochondrial protein AtMg00810-like n=1 Tax=Arachis hypogaea TaxID=3818 RepID=UPI000DECCC03|nr:uncharacterized protein LOC112803515 [Arachis hypogaea]